MGSKMTNPISYLSIVIIISALILNADIVTLKNGNKLYGLVQKFSKDEGIILEVDTGLVAIPPDSIYEYEISKQKPKIDYQYKEYNYPNQRNKEEISKVVIGELKKLRKLQTEYLYNKIVIKGKITVRFSINGLGKVVKTMIIKSDIPFPNFNEAVLDIVKTFKFSKLGEEDDITEIVYPFVFSNDNDNNSVHEGI